MRHPYFVASATIMFSVCAVAPPARAAVQNFSDGQTHVISGSTTDQFTLDSSSKLTFQGNFSDTPPTSSGKIEAVHASGNSLVTLGSGYTISANSTLGTARAVSLVDGNFTSNGGTLNAVGTIANPLVSFNSGNLTLNGVTINSTLYDPGTHVFASGYSYGFSAVNTAQTTINSANITAIGSRNTTLHTQNTFTAAVSVFGTTKTVINGGTFVANSEDVIYAMMASGQSELDFHGGTVSFTGGGLTHHFIAFNTSTIRIFGSGFKMNGVAISPGKMVPVDGFLNGYLQDGSYFGYNLSRDSTATIEFVGVALPEPSTASLLLGGAGITLARRRRPSVVVC